MSSLLSKATAATTVAQFVGTIKNFRCKVDRTENRMKLLASKDKDEAPDSSGT